VTRKLLVFFGAELAAHLTRDGNELTLTYVPAWRGRFPLSVSLPLAQAVHTGDVVESFLANLLPDNDRTLSAWARQFQASSSQPFQLLEHVGEDCAGAFAFVRAERATDYLGTYGFESLSEADVAERLQDLRTDRSAWWRASDDGHFSLSGAQSKLSLQQRDGEQWGVPSGLEPTTHILKPSIEGFGDHVHNEHFCLQLASELGLVAARSEVGYFEDESAIIVRRYDRVRYPAGGGVRRIHQEDFCQALGVPPRNKYQRVGGPTPKQIADVLRRHSTNAQNDIEAFRDALLFAYLTAGTDAHGKNYSVVHGEGGRVRLAPLYDLASALPYDSIDMHRAKLAMKYGRNYRIADVTGADVAALGEQLGLNGKATRARGLELADALLAAVESVHERFKEDGGDSALVERLVTELARTTPERIRMLEIG